ncbi:MAG: hypothetical protein QM757_25990 [Paludibaculum sp.]
MWEPLIPKEVSDWMDKRMWGIHHKVWHFARLWDLIPGLHTYVTDHGGRRADRQEGMAGNGLDFLAMHRNMIRMLRYQFPRYEGLWHGWNAVPTEPDNPLDPTDAMPPENGHRAFNPEMLKAIDILTNHLGDFGTDDDLGLFIETRNRPLMCEPGRKSPDPKTGIHNYLHGRFALQVNGCNPDMTVSMGNFLGNIKNQRFWRLHGWIDQRWTLFRKIKGLDENQPAYQAALKEQMVPMDPMGNMCTLESDVRLTLDFLTEGFEFTKR